MSLLPPLSGSQYDTATSLPSLQHACAVHLRTGDHSSVSVQACEPAVFVDKTTRVICQGFTGKTGTFHSEQVSNSKLAETYDSRGGLPNRERPICIGGNGGQVWKELAPMSASACSKKVSVIPRKRFNYSHNQEPACLRRYDAKNLHLSLPRW